MLGNKNFLYIILFILSFTQCNKKSNKDYSSYLYLFQNTSSGNCALIEKQIIQEKVFYKARAFSVSSNSCKESSFFYFVTNLEEAKKEIDKYYGNIASIYGKYKECSELLAVSLAQKDTFTIENIQNLANSNLNECIKLSPNVFYCKDDALLNSQKNKFYYHSISNAKQDMYINYQSQVFINGIINKTQNLGYEEGVIGNLRIAHQRELAILEGFEINLLYSFPQHQDCFRKIIFENANLKTAYTKIPKLQEFFREEITVANRKAITETLTPFLECHYGDEVTTQEQKGLEPAIGICPSLYPKF